MRQRTNNIKVVLKILVKQSDLDWSNFISHIFCERGLTEVDILVPLPEEAEDKNLKRLHNALQAEVDSPKKIL